MKVEDTTTRSSSADYLRLATQIVSAFVSNNAVPASSLPELIKSVHETILAIAQSSIEEISTKPVPAVPISESITPDHIICLEDGKELVMLKRYLNSQFDMTPEEYRAKWGLPPDYPMVAPNYAKSRSDLAKKIGLGKKPGKGKGKRK